MSNKPTFVIDVDMHVYPVLHLARMAISMERMLEEIEVTRGLLPEFDERMKNLGLSTTYGASVADYADAAIFAATNLLEAHQAGPIYVVVPECGAIEQ
jgi:hypothetical protein